MIVFIQVLLLLLVLPERASCSSREGFLLLSTGLFAPPEGLFAPLYRAFCSSRGLFSFFSTGLLAPPDGSSCSSLQGFLLLPRALLALLRGASAVPRRAVGRWFSFRCAKLIHFSINARLHRPAMKKYPFWRDKKHFPVCRKTVRKMSRRRSRIAQQILPFCHNTLLNYIKNS